MAIMVAYKDIGNIDYQEAWDYQEKIFDQVLGIKRYNDKISDENIDEKKAWENYILFCEHPHVYTLGKNGDEQNMLLDYIQLQAENASFYKINRGGDITYHGPGQIVGYPIINLQNFDLGVKTYVRSLEEAVILTIAEYGIIGDRLDGATGVWLDKGVPGKTRKICAIGVRVSHFITMHGFAFNVNTDLTYFNHINPCGFVDKGVTSLAKELGKEMDIEEVKMKLKANIAKVFNLEFEVEK